jgi:hypothetical protein
MGTEARITARHGSIPLKMLALGIVNVMSVKSMEDRTEIRRALMTQVLLSVRLKHSVNLQGLTYKIPKPKTETKTTFLYVAIWKLYSGCMGRRSTTTSVTKLMAPVTVNEMTWSPQLPSGMVLSQLNAKGRQIKQPARIVATVQATMTNMVA